MARQARRIAAPAAHRAPVVGRVAEAAARISERIVFQNRLLRERLSLCPPNRAVTKGRGPYGAKNPKMSRIRYVGFEAYALIRPFLVGTIARLDVMAPSIALSVAAVG